MKRLLLAILFFGFTTFQIFSQTTFRNGIFLHHSTGQYIWGPNPDGTSTTTIPDQVDNFNVFNGLSGNDAFNFTEEWWAPDDNEWSTQHEFFNGNTNFTDINDYLNNYNILVVKSCFPSSEIDSWGQPTDTLDPTYKSVYNYKWHWRSILKVMQAHPDHFFAIWTNAPLEPYSTNSSQAALAKLFTRWAKDTLAAGLDAEFGAFPPNVYVFDYFNKLTGTDGMELTQYRTGIGDSHPNGAATDFISPQFVNEICYAALVYEGIYNGIDESLNLLKVKVYPNPCTDQLRFLFQENSSQPIQLTVYNSVGSAVKVQEWSNTSNSIDHLIDVSALPAGLYSWQLSSGRYNCTGKLIKW